MSETAEPRSPAQDTVAMTAATMGHDIVAMILNELRTMPGHWPTLNEEYQQKAIERFKEKTADMVRKSIGFMLTSDFAAVPAKLEDLSRHKAIKAKLTISPHAMYRHALFDAQGSQVLLVVTDPDKWLTRMDEIKARGNQLDLFDPDANYDSERDQPGYRRDRDPLAPGKSWEELKRSLGYGDGKTAEGSPPAAGGGPTEEDPPGQPNVEALPTGESLTPEQEHTATLRELQEELFAVGVDISLGALQSRSDADILAASLWLKWYKSKGVGTPFMGRPEWLPEPPLAG